MGRERGASVLDTVVREREILKVGGVSLRSAVQGKPFGKTEVPSGIFQVVF